MGAAPISKYDYHTLLHLIFTEKRNKYSFWYGQPELNIGKTADYKLTAK
jgi:hypothetical protein